MENFSVAKILDAVPHDIICDRVSVKPRSLRLARERGAFPASWYSVMRRLCLEYGIECPEGLFKFKTEDSENV